MSKESSATKQRPWNKLRLGYTEPKEILRTLDVDDDRRVLVVGDGSNGAYEWVIEESGFVTKHSDCGYGIADIALRDGLIAYYGLPAPDGYFMREIAPKSEPPITPSLQSETASRDAIIEEIAESIALAPMTYFGPDPGGFVALGRRVFACRHHWHNGRCVFCGRKQP